MHLIKAPLPEPPQASETIVHLVADRRSLAKRRWRGTAEDGTEFGFDLQSGIGPGTVIHRADKICYTIAQASEAVLEFDQPEHSQDAVALAWQIGNLHFPLQAADGLIRTTDDPALRQMLTRLGIRFRSTQAVFEPLVAVAGHGHHHHAS